MSVDSEDGDEIENLKQEKAKDKSAFTRTKNKLLQLRDEEDYPSRREVRTAACWKLCEVQERAMETMGKLSEEYLRLKEREIRRKLGDEL